MSEPPQGRVRQPWHRRLEARVAGALGLLVAGALGVVLVITINGVSTQSRVRATGDLQLARTAFYNQLETRKASAISALELVTELPVFRAHFTDTRLANDRHTIDAMADGYRRQLGAQFVVVINADGAWLANPGWTDDEEGASPAVPADLRHIVDLARGGTPAGAFVTRGDELFLAVSTPARFGEEVLGTLTVGYRISDTLARDLARLAHCDVVVMVGDTIAATSLERGVHLDASILAGEVAKSGFGVYDGLYRVGSREFVAGAFPMQPDGKPAGPGRMVLLSDWQPTHQFVDRLRGRFLAGGFAAFTMAFGLGLVFSRSVTRPLRDIASAASKIAHGDLALQLPVRGTTEARTVADAFNDMSTRLLAARERLEHDAIHDSLTELPNRVLLMERLQRAMARRAQHPEYQFAVLFLDLDRFKFVNDSLGHAVGDRLLVALSERLARAVRGRDVVARFARPVDVESEPNTLARFGGDEFVILLDDIREPVDAVRVAERVQHELAVAFRLGTEEVFAPASIGVAVSSAAHLSGEDVVRDADLAMYRAKAAGGGGYVIFDDTMHDAAVERLRLETELRQAAARGEFHLWYQPIVALTDQTVKGFEALIRWRHPERGWLTPAAFLTVAEQIGLMAAIDEWALTEACRQARIWQLARPEREPLTVAVNLSSKAFGSAAIVSRVSEVLRATQLPACALKLEVTEGTAMADPSGVRETLRALRALGVRVCLDDFGTGYCSLSYLQQFEVDTLKIDRSFVMRIDDDGGQPNLVRLIVALAHTLGLEVIAEGTETVAQVEYLRKLGCGFAQGYYFGKAMPPEEISV